MMINGKVKNWAAKHLTNVYQPLALADDDINNVIHTSGQEPSEKRCLKKEVNKGLWSEKELPVENRIFSLSFERKACSPQTSLENCCKTAPTAVEDTSTAVDNLADS